MVATSFENKLILQLPRKAFLIQNATEGSAVCGPNNTKSCRQSSYLRTLHALRVWNFSAAIRVGSIAVARYRRIGFNAKLSKLTDLIERKAANSLNLFIRYCEKSFLLFNELKPAQKGKTFSRTSHTIIPLCSILTEQPTGYEVSV
jgi:hypothetical protein